MALDKRSLRKLRKRLPHNYGQMAIDELRAQSRTVSPSYISQVVTGVRFDQQVIEVLIWLADNHQANLNDLAARARGEVPQHS